MAGSLPTLESCPLAWACEGTINTTAPYGETNYVIGVTPMGVKQQTGDFIRVRVGERQRC